MPFAFLCSMCTPCDRRVRGQGAGGRAVVKPVVKSAPSRRQVNHTLYLTICHKFTAVWVTVGGSLITGIERYPVVRGVAGQIWPGGTHYNVPRGAWLGRPPQMVGRVSSSHTQIVTLSIPRSHNTHKLPFLIQVLSFYKIRVKERSNNTQN